MATGGGGTIGAANIELGVDTSKLDAGMAAAKSNVEAQTAAIESTAQPGGADGNRATLQNQIVDLVEQELEAKKQLAAVAKNTGDQTVSTLTEEQRYQQTLFALRKSQLTDEQSIVNWKKQGLAVQQQTTTATKETAAAVDDIAKNGEQVGGPNAFTKFFNDDMKEATKLFAAFGKLAIFKQVALDAYNLGQTIRESIIGVFTTGEERARQFQQTVSSAEPKARAEEYKKELERINGELALMLEFQNTESVDPLSAETWAKAWDGALLFVQGKTAERLKKQRQETEDNLKQNLASANAIDAKNTEIERNRKQEMLDTENVRLQIQGAKTEADKLDLKFREDLRQLNKRIENEKIDEIRQGLEQQKQLLYQNYLDDIDAFQKAEQEKADAETDRQREEKERERERRDERLQNIRDENEAARIALIEDPRKRAEEEFQANKRRLEKEIAAETDQATKYALNGKMQLLEETHQQTLRNIDREAQEERKAQNELAAEQARQVQEQFAQLRGEINSLFNAGNIEVGINRLGTLLEVLIQKTGDGR